MEKIISRFWRGEITLWRSYWLVGELLNALFILLIFNLEIYLFGNNQFTNFLPFLDFSNFSILSKLLIVVQIVNNLLIPVFLDLVITSEIFL